MELGVYKSSALMLDKFFAAAKPCLGDRCGKPTGEVEFNFGVLDQIAFLFKIMSDGDQLSMPFDDQRHEVVLFEADVEVILRLKYFQQVMRFEKPFDRFLKFTHSCFPIDVITPTGAETMCK